MAVLLRANIATEVRRAVGVAVRVAITDRLLRGSVAPSARSSVLVELLLREGLSNRRKPSNCLGLRTPLKNLIVISNRHQLTLGDIAQIGARGEVNGRRELGQELIWQVEIQIKPGKARALPTF